MKILPLALACLAFPFLALAAAPPYSVASIYSLLNLSGAECDVWSEHGSCRGASFGADCINDQHVTASCVPSGKPNWSGNYRCVCQ